MPLYEFICQVCEKKFHKVFHMNDEKNVYCDCGRLTNRIWNYFHKERDQLWKFTWHHTGPRFKGKSIEIYSRYQFKKLCKEAGYTQVTKEDLFDRGVLLRPKIDHTLTHKKIEEVYREIKPKLEAIKRNG